MKKEETTDKTPKKGDGFRKTLGRILNGKFFPREVFANYWGILLTVVALLLASIAHRNMYMVQLNKIKKLETQLIDRTTDRILLEYKRDENLRLHEISEAVERHKLPLISSPEPKKEIVVEPINAPVKNEK
ncbi:MAG: hypothetical protein IKM10_01440 [Bacteroidaceae bacterium]|nr:hypothetical protein [Bacteroidaceae bacterium]